ncbi:heavy metal translocating P-type ATPase [Arthrospira platensis]|uniref:Zinc-transporting P-type ATPase n=1 Tax=Limnospira platensis NIES-46 TaxID=1236695 RepID=A0A5M3TE07_LIMPL|nr:heavy metal translocating P-type ATPase [Arthrospira platensis]AMW30825.1 metal-transporting ATPase [Arthrospira platensis YZ]KDR55213.1 zinc ABC transporter ATPase [Arthrospira platensis str. Paraca]MBD2670145.1 cadmium-translocating P-type ATPase [Arthrospira platensis FACHB-439]MBD2710630.1 cadmium-translocating P-type ATPase [Arthrospira platensis FACHB-835]MDF2208154.1 heavy metal translocating P-type ATPase [Arthrospira platensis NCB002]MDT9184306.1 heavy metal translocating P-type A
MADNQQSSCCSCNGDDRHSDNRVSELIPLAIITAIYILALIFNNWLKLAAWGWGEYLVLIPVYLLTGWEILVSAGKNIWRGQIFDETFLMSLATLCAIAINEVPEAVAVMLFYRIGEGFQEFSVQRSRRSIKSLLAVRPDTANLLINGEIKTISPQLVNVGSTIVVKAGEKIPLDGEIISGTSQIDTSPLTGESLPRAVKLGEIVLAGTINQTGLLTIKVTKPFNESSISKILELVESAQNRKAKTEKFITTFARYYTPVVVILAIAIALIPPLLNLGSHQEWFFRALILLVISCPCGLVISIPLGYFGGVGGAARQGILVKGSTFLDDLAAVKTVIFDKTGTLTAGVFEVTEIVPYNNFTEAELIKIAAQIESLSNHPLAQAIRQYYGDSQSPTLIEDYQEIPGCGVKGKLQNRTVIAGGDRLLHLEKIDHPLCDVGATVIHLAVDYRYAGYILISDKVRPDSVAAIEALKKQGVQKIVMLTGDNQTVADRLAKTLNIDEYYAELMPEDKVKQLEKLLTPDNRKVAFVGDGINDAPAIARADVGIAMGGMGSDAAIETADVVVMTDSPSYVSRAIAIGRKTRRIVWQNIGLAMGIKGFFIILGIFGLATIWSAVFADVGVALLAILNATRISGKTVN